MRRRIMEKDFFLNSSIIIGSLAVNVQWNYQKSVCGKVGLETFLVPFLKRESSKRPFFSSSFSAFASPVLKAKNALMWNRWSGRLEPFSLPPSTSQFLYWCAKGELCIFLFCSRFGKKLKLLHQRQRRRKIFSKDVASQLRVCTLITAEYFCYN